VSELNIPLQLVFALLLAMFALATAVPLPVDGWVVETGWGTLLSGLVGFGVSAVVLIVVVFTAFHRKAIELLFVALPAIALSAFVIYHERGPSLDPRQLASLIEIDIESLRAQHDSRKKLPTPPRFPTDQIVAQAKSLKDDISDIIPGGPLQPDGTALQAWLQDVAKRVGEWPDQLPNLDASIANEISVLNDLRYNIELHLGCISDLEPQPNDRRDRQGRRIGRGSCGPHPDPGGTAQKAARARKAVAEQARLSIEMEIATVGKVVKPIKGLQEHYRHSLAVGIVLLIALGFVALRISGQLKIHWFTFGWMVALLVGQSYLYGVDLSVLPSQTANAALLLGVFIAGRALRLTWANNRSLWHSIKSAERSKLLLRSVLLWLPLGAVLCLAIYIPNYFADNVKANLYDAPRPLEIPTSISGLCLPPTDKLLRTLDYEQPELARDLDLGLRCLFDGVQIKAGEVLARDHAAGLAGDATQAVGRAFDEVVPGSLACMIDGAPQTSCIMSWANHEKKLNLIVFKIPHPFYIPERLAHNSYVETRAEYRIALLQRVKEEFEKVENAGGDAQTLMRSQLDAVIEELALDTRRAIYLGLAFWRSFDFVGLTLLAVSALKSFAYVLGRLTFAANPRLVNSSLGSPLRWDQVNVSDSASISLPDAGHFLVRFFASPQNASTGSLPRRPFSWRIPPWRRPLLFAAFQRTQLDPPTRFSTKGAKRFVIVRLDLGQKVFFRFSALYAASQGLKIARVWSFGLLNTFHQRLSHIEAEGPGILCLVCEGDPSGHRESTNLPHFTETHRLLMWASDASFEVKSKANPCAIYSGSVLLNPIEGSIALFEADLENRPFKGAFAFIPALFPI
jgi:hypothetical protein